MEESLRKADWRVWAGVRNGPFQAIPDNAPTWRVAKSSPRTTVNQHRQRHCQVLNLARPSDLIAHALHPYTHTYTLGDSIRTDHEFRQFGGVIIGFKLL